MCLNVGKGGSLLEMLPYLSYTSLSALQAMCGAVELGRGGGQCEGATTLVRAPNLVLSVAGLVAAVLKRDRSPAAAAATSPAPEGGRRSNHL